MTTALQRTVFPSSAGAHVANAFPVDGGLDDASLHQLLSASVAELLVGSWDERRGRLEEVSTKPFVFGMAIAPVADGPGAGDDPKEPTLSAGSLIESHSSCSSLGSVQMFSPWKGRQQRVKMVEAQPRRVREMRMPSPPGIPNRSRRWRWRACPRVCTCWLRSREGTPTRSSTD